MRTWSQGTRREVTMGNLPLGVPSSPSAAIFGKCECLCFSAPLPRKKAAIVLWGLSLAAGWLVMTDSAIYIQGKAGEDKDPLSLEWQLRQMLGVFGGKSLCVGNSITQSTHEAIILRV